MQMCEVVLYSTSVSCYSNHAHISYICLRLLNPVQAAVDGIIEIRLLPKSLQQQQINQ